MPPTRAAARYTTSMRCELKKSRTADWFVRSSSFELRLTTSTLPSASSRRTMAEPTMPRCPATNTRLRLEIITSLLLAFVDREAVLMHERVLARFGQVADHHLAHELFEGRARLPAELFLRLGRVAEQRLDFGRAVIARIDFDDDIADLHARIERDVRHDAAFVVALAFPAEFDADVACREVDELAHAMLLAGR